MFGIDTDGSLFHIDKGWTAEFHYLCVDGDCREATRANGRFLRNIADRLGVGQSAFIAFKVEDDGGQCLTGELPITRRRSLVTIDSPCADQTDRPQAPPQPTATPALPSATSLPDGPEPPLPDSADHPPGAGLTTVSGETITTRVAERFRQRHEGDLNHDTYIEQYAQGSTYEIVLIDHPESLEVQLHSPDAPLSMVNFTYGHIIRTGVIDPPQYAGGAFMAKDNHEGPANDDPRHLATRLYFNLRSIRERPWREIRMAREVVTLEFTPRTERDGNSPQYYSDILRYRAGTGGIILERDDARYFSAGSTSNFAHGSPGFELSQPFLGIDQALLHRFTLGREIFRASFLGDPLPGNEGTATGSPPNSPNHACVDCHFQLAKAAPPGRSDPARQGFIGDGTELRVAPALIGLGLLEAVDIDTIAGFADVSGGKIPVGRFGWKATEPTIRDQILKAFALDLGVDPIDPAHVDRIEDYIRGLGVPIRRHPEEQASQQPNHNLRVPETFKITDPDIVSGEAVFQQIGCAGCHIPQMQTGTDHPIQQFRNLTIRPFTDLLLWDMGPELCSEQGEGNAGPCEWRTAPLWGIRLQEWITGHATFLHDGRATTLEEAIQLHGGDAAAASIAYEQLPEEQRRNLLLYLLSL